MTSWPAKFTKAKILPAVILLFILLFTFWPEADKQFLLWDDESLISRHAPFLPVNANTFVNIAVSPFPAEYIPVTKLVWTFLILPMQWLAGSEWSNQNWVQPFIIVSLLFHFFNCLLVKETFSVLFKKPGAAENWKDWIPAFIYALHPLQVEALASASVIREPMWIFFGLLSLRSYLNFRLFRSVVFFVLACLSKPTAVVLAGIILVLHFAKNRSSLYRATDLKIFFSVLTFLAAIVIFINKSIHVAEDFGVSAGTRFLYSFDAFGFYLSKILLPLGLCADYGRTYAWLSSQGTTKEMFFFAAAAILLVVFRVRYKKHKDNLLILGSFFLLPLMPVSGILEFSMQRYSNVADHYAAFSIIGFAGAIYFLSERVKFLSYAAVIVCCFYLIQSHGQKKTWNNNQTLAEQILKVNPNSFMAHNNLGIHFHRSGYVGAALREFAEAIRLNPHVPNSYLNSAAILNAQENYSDAVTTLKSAVENNPGSSDLYLSLAKTLEKQSKPAEAIAVYLEAKNKFPAKSEIPFNLGLAYWKKNEFDLALAELQTAKNIAPQNAQYAETYSKIEELIKKIKSVR